MTSRREIIKTVIGSTEDRYQHVPRVVESLGLEIIQLQLEIVFLKHGLTGFRQEWEALDSYTQHKIGIDIMRQRLTKHTKELAADE